VSTFELKIYLKSNIQVSWQRNHFNRLIFISALI